MNTFFLMTVSSIALFCLFERTSTSTSYLSQNDNNQYYYYPSKRTTTTESTTTQKMTARTYRPQDLPATSDFPPSPNPPRKCNNSTACGWAVYSYEGDTKKVEYFTKNVCECREDQSCLRVDDDLRIKAYVFRCGPKQASTESYFTHW